MALRTLDLALGTAPSPLAPQAAPVREATPRRLDAVLRWRSRWLLRQLEPTVAQSLRLVPVLLQASVSSQSLRGEAPGVESLRLRTGVVKRLRAFDLSAPVALQRGRRLVAAVALRLTAARGPEVLVFAVGDIGSAEKERLRERLERVEKFLHDQRVRAAVTLVGEDDARSDSELVTALVAFGALLAGRLPPPLWDGPGRLLGAAVLSRMLERAPTPLSAAALVLMLGDGAPTPTAVLKRALREEASTALADPDRFAVRWAGQASGHGPLLERVLGLCRPGTGACPFPSEVMEAGRALAVAAANTVRAAERDVRAAVRPLLWRDFIGDGLPAVLLPALATAFRAVMELRRGAPLGVRHTGRAFEAVDASGATLARGASPDQALVRVLAPLARAGVEVPSADPRWRILMPRLAAPRGASGALLMAVEPAPREGEPNDPLNRGPTRLFGMEDALSLVLRERGRPTARRLAPLEAARTVVELARRGARVEVVAASGGAQPAVGRLARVARLACAPQDPERPLAVEAGGHVLWLGRERVRVHPLKRFAARPRLCTADPEAPDLSPWAEEKARSASAFGAQMILCHVSQLGDDGASVLYLDQRGWQLHEEVPLWGLEEYLADTREVLRAGASPMLLSVRYARALEPRLHQFSALGASLRVDLAVAGRLPFGLQVHCQGERFGAGCALGWLAAAQAVMAVWPSDTEGLLSCRVVSVLDSAGLPATGLARLYARSVALRRLRSQTGKMCRA